MNCDEPLRTTSYCVGVSNMKRILIIFGIVVLLAQSSAAQMAPPKDGSTLDAVVAVVGKHPIFKSTIDVQVAVYLLQRGITNVSPDTMMALRKQVLENEVDQKLMLAKADEDSVTISEQEVENKIDDQIKGYVTRFGSEVEVERQFGHTIAELKASPDLRARTRENLITQEEQYKVLPPAQSISHQDVEKFFNLYKDSLPLIGAEVELATIVKIVKPLPNQKEHSRELARAIVDSLKNGADFALMAKRYSQDVTASSGGDLGASYPRGTFLPAFEEAAFKLKPGEISDVVETEQGFHIIKLIERRGEEVHVAQILIKPTINAMDEEAVRDTLLQLRDSALHGADFGTLAQNHSDDAETRSFGGALGRIRLEDLAPEQRIVLDSMKEGDVSDPIHIAYPGNKTGFQIVKLIRKIPSHKTSLDEDYRELEQAALQWKASQDLARWIAHARSTIYVDVHDLSAYY
jgi:peptidyl-prolyl cis-trans isomerase SurA